MKTHVVKTAVATAPAAPSLAHDYLAGMVAGVHGRRRSWSPVFPLRFFVAALNLLPILTRINPIEIKT